MRNIKGESGIQAVENANLYDWLNYLNYESKIFLAQNEKQKL